MSCSPFQVSRQNRARDLIACCRHIGESRKYSGAVNNDNPHFDFDQAYNNSKLVNQRHHRISEDSVMAKSEAELSQAKEFFKKACRSCEFCKTTACGGKKSDKESLFWAIFNDPKTRIRFYNRIKTGPFKCGERTLPCNVAIKPGSLKKSEWIN